MDDRGGADSRPALSDFFEVDAKAAVAVTLSALARAGDVGPGVAQEAMQDLGIDPERPSPATL